MLSLAEIKTKFDCLLGRSASKPTREIDMDLYSMMDLFSVVYGDHFILTTLIMLTILTKDPKKILRFNML